MCVASGIEHSQGLHRYFFENPLNGLTVLAVNSRSFQLVEYLFDIPFDTVQKTFLPIKI